MKNAGVRHQIANRFFTSNTLKKSKIAKYIIYIENITKHSTAHNSSCRTMKPFLNDLFLIGLRHSREKSLDLHFFMLKISEMKILQKLQFFYAHFWHENDILPDLYFQK